ncbi:hypothetical protein Tco_0911245 [Tanacetum coccineum]|uniref:Uncharacterized protein n=1 Tax=Tanacetum coccineum TaxID=301880 RepID=A0ABQ5CW64_9ASTR
MLERDNMRLRGMLDVERQRVDRLWRSMSYVQRDLRQIHRFRYYDRHSINESDSRVNERQMQTTKEKVDTSKALDASLVNTESSGTESGKHDTSSRSGNDADADNADIKPVYDEEPMAEKTCNNGKSLSEIQLEHEKEDELVEGLYDDGEGDCKYTLGGSRGESFWEEGDDFRVDVLCFHTCLTDILGFLEKVEWWFEQDIDNEEEEDAKDGLAKQGNDSLSM